METETETARWAPPSASRRTSPSSSRQRGKGKRLHPLADANLWPCCSAVWASVICVGMGDLCAGAGGYGVRCGRVPPSSGEIYAEFTCIFVVLVHA
jgi:hypothetical protein